MEEDRQGAGCDLAYLRCREYLPLIWPEPLHPGVGQLDGMMEVRETFKTRDISAAAAAETNNRR